MVGMSRQSGQAVGRTTHILQSISDILTTPIGTRVLRRDYGSHLAALIDRPTSSATVVQLYAAVLEALARWEPRVVVQSVTLKTDINGRTVLDIVATDKQTGQALTAVTALGVAA